MTKFAEPMNSDKYLKIVSVKEEGPLADRCDEALRRLGNGRTILSIVFFIDSAPGEAFDNAQGTILKECERHFGKALPMVTCVAQKPFEATLSVEALFLGNDGTVEYNDDYLLIRQGNRKELITKGISYPKAGDTGTQAKAVFERIGDILSSEGFLIDEIVRQWNFIEDITGIYDGIQNYQLFNDARSEFYSKAKWTGGYPAATGIGCSAGGVTVSVFAVKNPAKHSHPIDNPIQVPAHKYSGKVLVAGKEAVKTTPKFERARLLRDTVLISGTAAIKGENSSISQDPRTQSEAAMEVVESLVNPSNIHPGCKHFRFEALRIYIKREEDAPEVISAIRERWKGVPVHFLKADICRPELLLEVEGTGTVRRFLECCCSDSLDAAEAQAGGAGRIELCEDLPSGGVTPSEMNIRNTLETVDIPVNVLVRPRSGNFVYNEDEIQETLGSIKLCKSLGVNGVVIGALKDDGSVDVDTMRRLIEAAKGMEITFHRAFDECSDPLKALEEIIGLGCDRLLTAGHATNVGEGAAMLKTLSEKAAGRIIILAGSGVRPGNIAALEASTGISEFHSSSRGADGKVDRNTVRAMVETICL